MMEPHPSACKFARNLSGCSDEGTHIAIQFFFVGIYLFGFILALVSRGDLAPRGFPSGLAPTLVSAVLLTVCIIFGSTASYGAAGVLFLVLLLGVTLLAFGLGGLTAAILWRFRDRKAVFYPAFMLVLSLPVGGTTWLYVAAKWERSEIRKQVLVFQETPVEGTIADRKVSVPAHPKISVKYTCFRHAGLRQAECQAFFNTKSALEIADRIPTSTNLELRQIRVRKPSRLDTCGKDSRQVCKPEDDQIDWCLRQRDAHARELCKAMPAHDIIFQVWLTSPREYYRESDMKPVDISEHIPDEDGDLFALVCREDDVGAAICRSSYKIGHHLYATVYFHRIPSQDISSIVAETHQKTKKIWQLMTDGAR
nr:hypothetical protein [uncultured Roseibium sp.]